MRRLSIFAYFLVLMTLCLHTGTILAAIPLIAAFVFLYNLAEVLDEEA